MAKPRKPRKPENVTQELLAQLLGVTAASVRRYTRDGLLCPPCGRSSTGVGTRVYYPPGAWHRAVWLREQRARGRSMRDLLAAIEAGEAPGCE